MTFADRIYNFFGLVEREKKADESIREVHQLRQQNHRTLGELREQIQNARREIHIATESYDEEQRKRRTPSEPHLSHG